MCCSPPKFVAPSSRPASRLPLEEHHCPARRHSSSSGDSPKRRRLQSFHIVEALSCLFRVTQFQVLATLYRLACHEFQPLKRFPRNRAWSVMEKVVAPYTELHDLRIYDSLYDRCGRAINPLDRNNAYKVMRLIFLMPVLVPEQRERLLDMLSQLNSRAACSVNLEGLLAVLEKVKLDQLVCDVLEQDSLRGRIVSAIQASFSFLVGLIVCKSTCTKSFVYASHFLMEAYGWFGTAYFMYDIWSMYKVHTQKIADKLHLLRITKGQALKAGTGTGSGAALGNGHLNGKFASGGGGGNNNGSTPGTPHEICDYDGACVQIPKDGRWDFLKYVLTHPVMMIHHVFIGTFGLLVVTYIRGGGHCIYSYMFMMEFSTPFVSLRSILSTMRLKESRVYIANGLLMLATFFVCRVCMWPYVMWRYSLAIEAASLWTAMCGLPRGCLISIAILFLPQLYWFYLMVLGALKVFLPQKPRPPNKAAVAGGPLPTLATLPPPTALINGKN